MGNMGLHARMEHSYSERGRIYKFLIDEGLRKKYSIPPNRRESVIGKASPRKILAYLSGGVPPRFGLGAITAGRESELELIRDWLAPSAKREHHLLLITGENGQGKSHLLGCAKEIALLSNYVVLRADIAADTVTLTNPFTFAARMLENGIRPDFILEQSDPSYFDKSFLLRLDSVARGELDQEEDEIISPAMLIWRMKCILMDGGTKGAFALLRRLQLYLPPDTISDEDIANSLSGSLTDFTMYMDILSVRLGYSGCVFIIDELEEDRSSGSYDVLESLIMTSHSNSSFLIAATPDLLWNPFDGMDVLRPGLGQVLRGNVVDIGPLLYDEMRELASKISNIYCAVYPVALPDKREIDSICEATCEEGNPPRILINRVLESLSTPRG